MRLDFFERYSRANTPIHRLWPGLKLAVALVLLIAIVLADFQSVPLFFAGCAIFVAIVAVRARIPAVFLLKRLLWFEPFVIGVAILAVFQPNGEKVFLAIVIKSTLCLLAMILLSNTTPFSEMLLVLRKMRVPDLLITTLAQMYRYLFVLVDEAERMKRARASRTFTRNRSHSWKSLATVIGLLFVRSTERAERIYAAMCARGWK